ncbi:MAG TPA: acetoacetate decarboxylase family protein [Polyangiaceae bacterium]|nr:acetoacetate decarboxylase family protein [Polyangiaceae bacterium]
MSETELAGYVTRGGVQTFAPPILAKGTRMTSLALEADPAALQRIVDQFLNGPVAAQSNQRFFALGNVVFLAYAPMDHISVTDPIDRNKGFMRETDVAIWMPLVGGKRVAGVFVPTSVYWFMPYVWVDVPAAMTTGREVFGFPKEMAWVQGKGAGADGRTFSLSTLVLPSYTPETELLEKPLFSVERRSDTEPGLQQTWTEAKDAFEAVAGWLHAEKGQI